EGLDEIAWVLIYRDGPLSAAELCERTRATPGDVQTALERLEREGRIRREADQRFASERLVLMADDGAWPAAMFDHYQSLVRTLIARLEADGSSDETGGSTYTLDIFDGHPLEGEVRGTLARLRRELGELWDRVEAENAKHGLPPRFRQVVVYAGQSSREEEKS
ncbi:MAG TPA: MarR family transcriptional regulator, partial [Polyangiaceae bacterium]|nr:MarR family transcriptional regulator [Polyangiaceae bacterium]